jgi:hypothetical protein
MRLYDSAHNSGPPLAGWRTDGNGAQRPDWPFIKENYMTSPRTPTPLHSWNLALLAAGTLLVTSAAMAAAPDKNSDAQKTYQQDRAACMSGQSNQDRATCLKEAGAALQEARRGGLDNGSDGQGQFEKNRMLRCDSQPAQDRADCLRRMNGEGTTRGSVESGGIYRELTTTVPAPGN